MSRVSPVADPARFLAAVTFDVTGTLVHCPRLGEIYAETLADDGIHLSPHEIRRLFSLVWAELDCRVPAGCDRFRAHPGGPRGFWTELIERLCRLAGQGTPTPLTSARLYDAFAHAEAWEVYPEVPAVLSALRAGGLRLGVISNWDERLPGLLDELGLAPLFDVTLLSQEEGMAKPSPELFRLACRRLGLLPGRVLHVGDSSRLDVEGARAAGMQALLLHRGQGAEKGDLAHLGELLERMAPLPDSSS